MKIRIGQNDSLPEGEYELTNPEKLQRAKAKLPLGSNDRELLLKYDELAGEVKDSVVLPAQSLWNIEKKHMDKPIDQYTDEELLVVIRRAENTNIPGSQYQRANTEYQIRHQQKILEATKGNRNGVFFEVGGDMTNHGVIQTDKDAVVNIAVAGDYSSNNKTKIIQGTSVPDKEWYEKPLGLIVIAVIAGVIIGGFLSLLHWN